MFIIDRFRGSRRSELAAFRNAHAGERCFIMGNGPSLNEMDLSLLGGDKVFGLNLCCLLFPRIDWRPSYWVCIDTRVLPNQADKFIEMQNECPDLKMFMPAVLLDHPCRRVKAVTADLIPKGKNRYFFREKLMKPPLPAGAFSLDMSRFLVSGLTVSITALQIAAYMGFNPIYLIGCDTSYHVPDSARRYGPLVDSSRPDSDTQTHTEMYITGTSNDDPNHFDPSYFGANCDYHAPNVEKMIWHYELAKAVLDKNGIRVINATVGGNLEVFPRVDYASLF